MKQNKPKKLKREIVKVHKTGIALVVAIFLFEIFLMFEVNLGIVAAVTEMTYSASSNTQFNSPGAYQSFSQQYASTYWPALSNRDTCTGEGASDFLMAIRPGGCEPAVVRSDLLEEQNVPVFCKVDIIKINPLIDVTKLKSVKFTGDYGKYVAGVSFHPNQEAVYSQKALLNNPLINDVGYVVIVLKRTPAEKDMPGSVKINLTGVLQYDSEGFFGAGKNSYYLAPLTDAEWNLGERYKEDSIFKGRAYLRADAIGTDKAMISIYQDKDTKITSFTLEKGKTSDVYYLPGFYCRAGVKLNLNDLTSAVKRVLLEVDDNRVWLTEGETFLDGNCRVSTISVGKETDGKQEKSVKISCKDKSSLLSYTDIVDKSGTTPAKVENKVTDDIVSQYFDKTKTYAENIDILYGAVESNSGEILSAKALYLLGVLANDIGKGADAIEIFNKVIDKYPDSPYANSAKLKLTDINAPATNYKNANIKLIMVEEPSKNDSSADFSVRTKGSAANSNSAAVGVQENQLFAKDRFKLLKLYEDKVYLEYFNEGEKDKEDKGRFYLTEGSTEVKGNYVVTLNNINLKQFAKISVISEIKEYSEASFSAEIGIEKRAIQLTPEKAKKLISDLNKTIQDWQKIIDRLGNVVSGMKAACFATSAVLIAKNFFSNLGGGATARQAVMPEYYKQCEHEVGKDSATFNACLKDKNSQIEKDIGIYKGKLDKFNDEIIALQNANKVAGTDTVDRKAVTEKLRQQYFTQDYSYTYKVYNKETDKDEIKTGTITAEQLKTASLTDLRDLEFSKLVQESDVSEVTKRTAQSKTAQIGERLSKKTIDTGLYSGQGMSWVNSVQPQYYRSGKFSGLAYKVPIPKSYAKKDAGGAKGDVIKVEPTKIGTEVISSYGTVYERIKDRPNGDNWQFLFPREATPGVKQFLDYEKWGNIQEPRLHNPGQVSGFYAIINEGINGKGAGYTDAGDIKEFTLKNVGSDEHPDVSGDQEHVVNYATLGRQYESGQYEILGLSKTESAKLVKDAVQAIKLVNSNYGKNKFNLFGQEVTVNLGATFEGKRCQDFMSAQDCWILFNVCDPVICPSSRCNLGGAYKVDDVIQSGIVGSIALCLPNIKEPIFIPVCLSGIHAGLEAYVNILKSYRDCLQESLDTGRTVGICDEVHSIYLCEFFWRQIGPFLDILLRQMIESSYGQGMKGGGEYLTVQDAWSQAANSIDFLKNDYAANSYKAFQMRSTGEIGTEFCKSFVSAKFPNNKDFFDNLLQPDSPVQFSAYFDEIKFTGATVPATSQYKVFYIISAGHDIGASYQVYLKDPDTSAYTNAPSVVVADTGYIPRGGYNSQTKDLTAPAGYKQLCVRINGKDECGFKKVSTDFGLNYVSDLYYQEQLKMNIRTQSQCVSGQASAYSLIQPNVEAGVSSMVNPSLEKEGVVRICSNENPGKQSEPNRWADVGYCNDESVRCWLDKNSVKNVIKNKNISADVLSSVENLTGVVEVPLFNNEEAGKILDDAKKLIDRLKSQLGLISANTDKNARRQQILDILNTESSITATANVQVTTTVIEAQKIDLSVTLVALQKIENSEGLNVTNNVKAEAAYYKFTIYYLLTDALYKATEPIGVAGGVSTTTTGTTEGGCANVNVDEEGYCELNSDCQEQEGFGEDYRCVNCKCVKGTGEEPVSTTSEELNKKIVYTSVTVNSNPQELKTSGLTFSSFPEEITLTATNKFKESFKVTLTVSKKGLFFYNSLDTIVMTFSKRESDGRWIGESKINLEGTDKKGDWQFKIFCPDCDKAYRDQEFKFTVT